MRHGTRRLRRSAALLGRAMLPSDGGVAEAKVVVTTIISDASSKFQEQEALVKAVAKGAEKEINEMKIAVEGAFDQMKEKIMEVEHNAGSRGGQGGGPEGRLSGYIPTKNMLPKVYSGKVEEWKLWKDEVADYIEMIKPGMKSHLKKVGAGEGEQPDGTFPDWLGQGVDLYRALKQLTDGEAKKMVLNAKGEDG